MSENACPHCGTSLLGAEIPVEQRAHRAHHGAATHYRREIGVEIPEVYDGVLYWRCPDCGGTWHRWSAIHEIHAHLHKAAEPYIHGSES